MISFFALCWFQLVHFVFKQVAIRMANTAHSNRCGLLPWFIRHEQGVNVAGNGKFKFFKFWKIMQCTSKTVCNYKLSHLNTILRIRSLSLLTQCQESVPRWPPGCFHSGLWPTCTSRGHQWSDRLQSAHQWSLQTLPEFLKIKYCSLTDHKAALQCHQVAVIQRESCTRRWPRVEPFSFDCLTTNNSSCIRVIICLHMILNQCEKVVYYNQYEGKKHGEGKCVWIKSHKSSFAPTSVVRHQHVVAKCTQYLLTHNAYLSSEWLLRLSYLHQISKRLICLCW